MSSSHPYTEATAAPNPNMDSIHYLRVFVNSSRAILWDRMLYNKMISGVKGRNEYGDSPIHGPFKDSEDNENSDTFISIYYLLTYEHPVDVNGTDNFGCTPIWRATNYGSNPSVLKVLIDFGGDRTIKSDHDCKFINMTPLDFAKEINSQDIVKLLTEYFPSEEEKLNNQLECKRQVDSQFKDKGYPRFKQDLIDLKYHSLSLSLDAVKTGDLNLLTESLPHIDVRMAVSLTLIAIERDQIHLMGCLLEKFVRERAFEVRNDKSVEPLLYIGLDPSPYSECSDLSKPSSDVVESVNRSRVLCLFKILYHKYIFLDVNSIFDLVQTLMLEGLY
jgi:hypothetical protein